MYGEWITVFYDEVVECKVWVACVPDTPIEELHKRAKEILKARLKN